jgi:hypothetical protein
MATHASRHRTKPATAVIPAMLKEEALWLKQLFRELQPQPEHVLLDVGSSNEYFRRVMQPFIDYYVFRPLRRSGVRIVHIDARQDEGVDFVCDLANPGSEDTLSSLPKGHWVLGCNLLEHVLDRSMVVRRLQGLTRLGGHLIVTVPHVYQYHPDPIDTMYRPTNDELEREFSMEFDIVRSELLDAECPYSQAEPISWITRQVVRVSNLMRRALHLKQPPRPRCSVAAVVLRRHLEHELHHRAGPPV